MQYLREGHKEPNIPYEVIPIIEHVNANTLMDLWHKFNWLESSINLNFRKTIINNANNIPNNVLKDVRNST